MLESVQEEISELEVSTPEGMSHPDLIALRAIEADLIGHSAEYDPAEVLLAHDTRSPEQRVQDALEAAGVHPDDQAYIQERASRLSEDDVLVHEGTPSSVIADPMLTTALGVDGVPATRDSGWEGRGVQIVYSTREFLGVTIVDQIHARVGRDANATDVALHQITARRLQQLQGIGGIGRRLWGRISAIWDGMPADVKRPGTRGFEAHEEIQKLPEIIRSRQAELEAYNRAHPEQALPDEVSQRLAQEVESLEGQLAHYEAVVRDMEAISEGGRGWIASLPSDTFTLHPDVAEKLATAGVGKNHSRNFASTSRIGSISLMKSEIWLTR